MLGELTCEKLSENTYESCQVLVKSNSINENMLIIVIIIIINSVSVEYRATRPDFGFRNIGPDQNYLNKNKIDDTNIIPRLWVAKILNKIGTK